MFHHESWKPTYFAVKRSKVHVTSHNKFVPVFRQNATLLPAAYVSHAEFSLRQCHAAQVML